MDAPRYVHAQYTVEERDAIFTKANKYPDAANGLQNQVPMIFPDGTIGWRQIPEGGDGTANANIAVVEQTQYASQDYSVGDLLIYNGQLYRVSAPIAAGGTITPGTNVVPTTVALWAPESFVPLVGKGRNLLDNAYFIGGGTGYGVFPVNQRKQTQYSATSPAQPAFDRWKVSYTVATLTANGVELVPSGGYGLLQYLSAGRWDLLVGKTVTLSALVTANSGDLKFYSGSTLQATRTGTGVLSATFVVPSGFPASSKFIGIQGNATISAVKLELGTQQTLARQVNSAWVLNDPPPDYGEELAKCQRYLWLEANVSANSYVCANGVANTTTSAIFTLFLPQNLRESGDATLIASSVAVYSNTDNSTRNCTAVRIASLLGNNVGISATISGATRGESVRLVVIQGGSFGISKEL